MFIDSEATTWNMDPDLLEEAIKDRIKKTGKKPKAVIVVHLYGMPAQMDRIMKICNAHDIPVIEEAAEAHGAEYRGQKIGGIGDATCFSFYATKTLATGEGGMICTNDAALADRCRIM